MLPNLPNPFSGNQFAEFVHNLTSIMYMHGYFIHLIYK